VLLRALRTGLPLRCGKIGRRARGPV